MRNFSCTAVISTISQWEVSMLAMKGGLVLKPDEESWFSSNLAAPFHWRRSLRKSCRLPEFHGDPTDRIIVATAITMGIPLITADQEIIRSNGQQQIFR